jgi:BNR repeat-containing family member
VRRMGIIIGVLGLFIFIQPAQADWTTAKRLTWTSGDSAYPAMAVDSANAVHVVWEDDTNDNYEIYYKNSTDGGITWSAQKRLSWTSGGSYAPAIAVDSNDSIHVVWEDDTLENSEIFYKRSMDGGKNWSAINRLTWNAGQSYDPAIAIGSAGAIYLVWDDNPMGNAEVFYKRSINGGNNWSVSKKLTSTSGNSYLPAVAIGAGETIHIVWEDDTPGNYEIHYMSSSDGGTTWSPAKRITSTAGNSHHAAIVIDSADTIHVVWHDYDTPGNSEIYYKRGPAGGKTWNTARRLTSTSGNSCYPAMAIDSGDIIHVVWANYAPGNYEIFHKSSTNGGVIWKLFKRLTWTSGQSLEPAMAVDSEENICIVWFDNTPGNNEIFFKKGK